MAAKRRFWVKVLHDMEQSNGNVIRKSTCTFSKTHTASIFVQKKKKFHFWKINDDRKKVYLNSFHFLLPSKFDNIETLKCRYVPCSSMHHCLFRILKQNWSNVKWNNNDFFFYIYRSAMQYCRYVTFYCTYITYISNSI